MHDHRAKPLSGRRCRLNPDQAVRREDSRRILHEQPAGEGLQVFDSALQCWKWGRGVVEDPARDVQSQSALWSHSQRHPKSGHNALGKTVIQSIGTSVFVILAGLISGIVAARALGVSGRGDLAAVILWPVLIASLAELGLPTAFACLSALHAHARHDLARSILPLVGAQSALSYLVGIPVILIVLHSYSVYVRTTAIGFLVALIPLYLGVRFLSSLNQGAGRMRVFNGTRLLVPVVTSGLLLALAMFRVASVRAFASAYIAAWLVALMVLLGASTREIRSGALKPHIDWPTARSSWSEFATRTYFGSLALVDRLQVDVLLATAVLGAEQAGLYYVATSAASTVRVWGSTLGAIALPRVAAADSRQEATSLLSSSVRTTMVLSGVCAAILFVFARPLLTIVYGQEFASAEMLVRILTIGSLAGSLRYALGDGLRGFGRHTEATQAEVVGLLLGGVTLVGLLPVWGLNGVAVAVSVSYCCTLVVMLAFSNRLGAGPMRVLMPRIGDIRSAWRVIRLLR